MVTTACHVSIVYSIATTAQNSEIQPMSVVYYVQQTTKRQLILCSVVPRVAIAAGVKKEQLVLHVNRVTTCIMENVTPVEKTA